MLIFLLKKPADILCLSHILWSIVLPGVGDRYLSCEDQLNIAETLFPLVAVLTRLSLKQKGTLEVVHYCCEIGSLRVTRWLAAHNSEIGNLPNPVVRNLLLTTCEHGHLHVAQWLAVQFGLSPADVKFNNNVCLRFSCQNGNLELIKWIVKHFKYTEADFGNSLLVAACSAGNLAVAQWLAAKFKLTAQDVRNSDNACFHLACGHGHLELAKWLVSHFGLTYEDTAANCTFSSSVHLASLAGYVAVVKWLTQRFGITIDDPQGQAFATACANGHLDMAKWLVQESRSTYSDNILKYCWKISCGNGQKEVTNWLTERFGTTVCIW